jgi:hypothetical protein
MRPPGWVSSPIRQAAGLLSNLMEATANFGRASGDRSCANSIARKTRGSRHFFKRISSASLTLACQMAWRYLSDGDETRAVSDKLPASGASGKYPYPCPARHSDSFTTLGFAGRSMGIGLQLRRLRRQSLRGRSRLEVGNHVGQEQCGQRTRP